MRPQQGTRKMGSGGPWCEMGRTPVISVGRGGSAGAVAAVSGVTVEVSWLSDIFSSCTVSTEEITAGMVELSSFFRSLVLNFTHVKGRPRYRGSKLESAGSGTQLAVRALLSGRGTFVCPTLPLDVNLLINGAVEERVLTSICSRPLSFMPQGQTGRDKSWV